MTATPEVRAKIKAHVHRALDEMASTMVAEAFGKSAKMMAHQIEPPFGTVIQHHDARFPSKAFYLASGRVIDLDDGSLHIIAHDDLSLWSVVPETEF